MAQQKISGAKILSGRELVGYIQERQAREGRQVKGAIGRQAKLAIIQTHSDPKSNVYVNSKKKYGAEIGVDVDLHMIPQKEIIKFIEGLNKDVRVDGIIVQLPIENPKQTDEVVRAIAPEKDVDGLGPTARFDSATATAILWLLAGYNIELNGKTIVVVGQGRLVGKPLSDYLETSGHNVIRCDEFTKDVEAEVRKADVLVSATGQPALIKSDWIKPGAAVVDAGVADENGKLVGDIEETALERTDLAITPRSGGVGPLTVCALLDNTLKAART